MVKNFVLIQVPYSNSNLPKDSFESLQALSILPFHLISVYSFPFFITFFPKSPPASLLIQYIPISCSFSIPSQNGQGSTPHPIMPSLSHNQCHHCSRNNLWSKLDEQGRLFYHYCIIIARQQDHSRIFLLLSSSPLKKQFHILPHSTHQYHILDEPPPIPLHSNLTLFYYFIIRYSVNINSLYFKNPNMVWFELLYSAFKLIQFWPLLWVN